jgi:hypothetical protein
VQIDLIMCVVLTYSRKESSDVAVLCVSFLPA